MGIPQGRNDLTGRLFPFYFRSFLDKGLFSNLAFRKSVTHKWVIPQAHYMPVRAAERWFTEVQSLRDRRITCPRDFHGQKSKRWWNDIRKKVSTYLNRLKWGSRQLAVTQLGERWSIFWGSPNSYLKVCTWTINHHNELYNHPLNGQIIFGFQKDYFKNN